MAQTWSLSPLFTLVLSFLPVVTSMSAALIFPGLLVGPAPHMAPGRAFAAVRADGPASARTRRQGSAVAGSLPWGWHSSIPGGGCGFYYERSFPLFAFILDFLSFPDFGVNSCTS